MGNHCLTAILSSMKVALVHELLTIRGGAEKVLRILAELFPDAPIYTLLYNERKLGDWFPKERVKTSTIQSFANHLNHFPFSLFHYPFDHHLYLKRFPAAVEAWDFSSYDLVLSSSSAFAHGIITNGKPKHLCYVHSPARYLWDRTHDVMEQAGKGILGPLKRSHLSRTFHNLRTWDAEAADRPDRLIAASQTVQRRIRLYWHRDSTVVNPPLDDHWLQESSPPNPQSPIPHPYFFLASTLARYKNIELAIAAANQLKVPLKIAGEGQDEQRLRSLAGPTVEFLGYQSQEQLRDLYANAIATVFPGDEDFGLVPLESLACGTPVVALRSGGAVETLTDDVAAFFDAPNALSLASALERITRKKRDPATCRTTASRFARSRFVTCMQQEIAALMGKN